MSKRKLAELDLFCRAGVGIEPIAPAICRVLRELIGAEAAALFWMDANGLPAGFHHEDSPDSARDLFVNEFERLFVGGAEINVSTLARLGGSPVGRLLAPEKDYFRSNTFNLLVKPSGHHHALDLRIDIDGRARAIVILFRNAIQQFSEREAQLLALAAISLRRAIAAPVDELGWGSSPLEGHLIVDAKGTRLLMLNDAAEAILKACTLVGQGIRLSASTTAPPGFVRALCARLDAEGAANDTIAIPTGRLQMRAERLRHPGSGKGVEASVLVNLRLQEPNRLRSVERVLAVGLSPIQQQIALVAATGGTRLDSLGRVGLSNEALKKHLAVIYPSFGVNGWEDLARVVTAQ